MKSHQQHIRAKLAGALARYYEAGLDLTRELMDEVDEAKREAKEMHIDICEVDSDVRESRDLAAHARAIQEQYEDDPEMFEGVRPGLLERFIDTGKSRGKETSA